MSLDVSLPVLIVGQGLAGTALGWWLLARGVPFLVVDRVEAVTSSRIAAGLVTPVTGMRMSLSEGYAELWPEALAFYRERERALGTSFFHEVAHVRLFKNEVEPDRWAGKCRREEFSPFVEPGPVVLDESVFHNPRGGFQMRQSGRLETAVYLERSREHFMRLGAFAEGEVTAEALEVTAAGVRWKGATFSQVVWCTGWEAMRHPWFDWVPFKPARGTIVSVAAGVHGEQRVLHHGCWLVPGEDGVLRAGSTFDTAFREPGLTTEAEMQTLHARLGAALRGPYEVVERASAVRPIIAGQRTLIGRHPGLERVWFFNGLGAKGALRAPHYARLLAQCMVDGKALPLGCDVRGNL